MTERISSIELLSTDRIVSTRGNSIQFTNEELSDTTGYSLKIGDDILTPSKIISHKKDSNLLVLTPTKKDKVFRVDTETGKVLDSCNLIIGDGYSSPFDYATPSKKYANLMPSDVVELTGFSDNILYEMKWDTRVPDSPTILDNSKRTSKNYYTSLATTKEGDIIVGDKKGVIRLFSAPTDTFKISKTNLNQYPDEVINVDTSSDGEWILWTTKEFIAVVNTKFKNKDGISITGFKASIPKNERPNALLLDLDQETLDQYGIKELNFNGAKFDHGSYNEQVLEEAIVASTGEYIIYWNMRDIKNAYGKDKRVKPRKISRQSGNVIDKVFRYRNRAVYAALEHEIVNLKL